MLRNVSNNSGNIFGGLIENVGGWEMRREKSYSLFVTISKVLRGCWDLWVV
ncbi:hypothetical protein YN1HA_19070 [Sulfurisphaera ohwakuensis]